MGEYYGACIGGNERSGSPVPVKAGRMAEPNSDESITIHYFVGCVPFELPFRRSARSGR